MSSGILVFSPSALLSMVLSRANLHLHNPESDTSLNSAPLSPIGLSLVPALVLS